MVLLTSEVVTNAVLHAGPHKPNDEILLSVDRTADLVRVEVTDAHPNRPTIGTPDRLSGRGLLFLDTLAHAWGVLPNEVGKVVWFEVKAAPSSPAGEPVGLPGVETRRTPSGRPGREPLGRAVEPGVLP